MAGRTVPYKVLFADVRERDVARAGLGDLAALERTSVSRKIVGLILDEVLTEEPHTRWYMGQIYSHIDARGAWDGRYGVVDALMDAFSEAAVYPFADAFGGLAVFARDLLRIHRATLRRELYDRDFRGQNPLPHLLGNFDAACEIVERNGEGPRDGLSGAGPASYGRQLSEAFRSGWGDPAFNLASYLLDHWELVGGSTHAYRALRSLLEATERWDETPEDRVDFARASAVAWEKYEEAKGAERGRA